MNKEFTQKDADELLNIELACIQLVKKVQTLRIKFAPTPEELAKQKKPTKRQLQKMRIQAMVRRSIERTFKQGWKHRLLNGEGPEVLFNEFPEHRNAIQKTIDDLKKH
jgi:hypothetical protein